MRVFISIFCTVLLLGVCLPIGPADAQRDEATVAAHWDFNEWERPTMPQRKDWMAISRANRKPLMASQEKR